MTSLVSLAALGLLLTGAPNAGAKEQCLRKSALGQEQRARGQLTAARASFLACAHDPCPSQVKADCAKSLADVERRLPTVVFRVHTPSGTELTDVQVLVDDKLLVEKLDRHSVPLDPGMHILRFELEGAPSAETDAVIREGEKDRVFDVVLEAPAPSPAPAPAPTSSSPPPGAEPAASAPLASPPITAPAAPRPSAARTAAAAVATGVSAAALGTFVWLGVTAKSDVDELRRTCAPNCTQAAVDSAERKALIANVSLGLAAASAGAAAYLWLSSPSTPQVALLPASSGVQCVFSTSY